MDDYGLTGSLLKKIQGDTTLKKEKYNSDIEFDFLSNLYVEFDRLILDCNKSCEPTLVECPFTIKLCKPIARQDRIFIFEYFGWWGHQPIKKAPGATYEAGNVQRLHNQPGTDHQYWKAKAHCDYLKQKIKADISMFNNA